MRVILQGIALFLTIGYFVLTLSVCGRGDRGGVSWFDLPLIPLNRAERRKAR